MNTFLPIAGFCPITQRDPTACVYVSFRRACAKFRERLYQRTGIRIDQPCRPVPPVEAQQGPAVPAPQPLPTKETAMAANKMMTGVCPSCGKRKNLVSHLGKQVCSGCVSVRIAAKNNPDRVIATLREFGAFPSHSQSVEDTAALKAELEILKTENASLVQEVTRLRQSDNGNRIGDFLNKFLAIDSNGLRIDIRPIRRGIDQA